MLVCSCECQNALAPKTLPPVSNMNQKQQMVMWFEGGQKKGLTLIRSRKVGNRDVRCSLENGVRRIISQTTDGTE